jgi:hypothetical protein
MEEQHYEWQGYLVLDILKGQLYYDNGQKAYEGDFRDGKFHNFGHLFNKWPSKDTKPFDFKNFKFLGDNWVRYEGDFQEDK